MNRTISQSDRCYCVPFFSEVNTLDHFVNLLRWLTTKSNLATLKISSLSDIDGGFQRRMKKYC